MCTPALTVKKTGHGHVVVEFVSAARNNEVFPEERQFKNHFTRKNKYLQCGFI